MKLFLGLIFLLYPYLALGDQEDCCQTEGAISRLDYVLFENANAIEKLHRLKIGYVDDVIKSLEEQVGANAKLLFSELKNKNLATNEKESVERQLALIFVMAEKLKIQPWKDDKQLNSAFEQIKVSQSESISHFRCMDWSQPMWKRSTCKE